MKPHALAGIGLAALMAVSPACGQPAPSAAAPSPPASAPAPASATPLPAAAPEKPDNLKVAQDPTRRLKIGVMINGQGPFDFIIDTGSDRTVISRELAAQLGLNAGRNVVVHETIGSDEVSTVVIRRLSFGSRTLDDIEAPAVAEKDIGAMGLLALDALHDLHIVMDFKTLRLTASTSRPEPMDHDTIIVHGRSKFGQLILVDAEVRGVKVAVVLDTGSDLSVGNTALLKLLTGRERSVGTRAHATLTSVTGRTRTVALETIDEARIGGLYIRNLPLGFDELPIFERFGLTRQPALYLGMDVLSQCRRIAVDFKRREAVFTLN